MLNTIYPNPSIIHLNHPLCAHLSVQSNSATYQYAHYADLILLHISMHTTQILLCRPPHILKHSDTHVSIRSSSIHKLVHCNTTHILQHHHWYVALIILHSLLVTIVALCAAHGATRCKQPVSCCMLHGARNLVHVVCRTDQMHMQSCKVVCRTDQMHMQSCKVVCRTDQMHMQSCKVVCRMIRCICSHA
jgi:hypothetical protein